MAFPDVPYIPYDSLRKKAHEVLAQYGIADKLPVPIEELLDLQLGVLIIPVPNLRDNYDMDASTSHDLTTIWVDKHVYDHVNTRYRFSLAHEFSHMVLHRDVFAALACESTEDWKAAITAIPETSYAQMESQADNLAGLLLVPPSLLRQEFNVAVKQLPPGMTFENATETAMDYVEASIAKRFEVSRGVIRRRCDRDGLWKLSNPPK